MNQSNYLRPINNDRMGTMAAFRSATQEARSRTLGAAAPALHNAPPRPTQLDDSQAEVALTEVQQQSNAMAQVHSGLDADRVARLLGMLD